MKIENKTEIEFNECSVICKQTASLGALYDDACRFKAFISEKIKEVEEAEKKKDSETKE